MSTRERFNHLIEQVSTWDQISVEPHRFGGVEFSLDQVEIGHVHTNGMVDIPFTRALRETLVANGLADPHHVLPESGWITFMMHSDEDVVHARRLLRLSYLQKRVRRDKTFSTDEYEQALAELEFPSEVVAVMPHSVLDT